MGSAMVMICASFSLKSASMLVRPWPPQPIRAMFTFSLGGTNPGPPSTWRGTMVNAVTAPAVAPINFLRLMSFFIINQGLFRRSRLSSGKCCRKILAAQHFQRTRLRLIPINSLNFLFHLAHGESGGIGENNNGQLPLGEANDPAAKANPGPIMFGGFRIVAFAQSPAETVIKFCPIVQCAASEGLLQRGAVNEFVTGQRVIPLDHVADGRVHIAVSIDQVEGSIVDGFEFILDRLITHGPSGDFRARFVVHHRFSHAGGTK